jgi:hypothetical protein
MYNDFGFRLYNEGPKFKIKRVRTVHTSTGVNGPTKTRGGYEVSPSASNRVSTNSGKYSGMTKNGIARVKAKQLSAGRQFSLNKTANKISSFEECMKPMQLLDFNRRSYESSYNSYYNDNSGTTKSNRIKIKGYKFFDNFNNQIAEVEVESRNGNNIITKFDVSSQYSGLGFAKDLLKMAKTSLSANMAEIDISEESKIRFFENNGFINLGIRKQTCILKIEDVVRAVDKPTSVELFDKPFFNGSDSNSLYNTGGLEYEGYRNYL